MAAGKVCDSDRPGRRHQRWIGRDVVDSWLDAHRRGSWAIRRPEHELAAIARLAGIEVGPVADVAARHAFEQLRGDSRGPLKETRRAVPGSWRENLSPAEQGAMHEVMGKTVERVGYRVEVSEEMADAA
jgi:hypothetical protein